MREFEEMIVLGLRWVIDARGWSHSICSRIIHGVIVTIVPVAKVPRALGLEAVDAVNKRIKFG